MAVAKPRGKTMAPNFIEVYHIKEKEDKYFYLATLLDLF